MVDIKNYLSYEGLKLYDQLIKEYIATADEAVLNQILGEIKDGDATTIAALNNLIAEVTGTAGTALQQITKGTDGQFVTTTVSEKSEDKTQSVAVSVTTAALSDIEKDGLVTASDARATLDEKVDKAEGSRLMTDVEGTKLAGIAEGAQVNVIETVKVNGTELEVTDKAVNITIPAATVTAVKEGDKVLALDGTLLTSEISLSYDSGAKEIYLKGKGDTVISTVNASDFIKDGMISNVAWSTETGKETTLVITFNTDAGKEEVEVDFQKLVDTYTSGNGIDVNGKVVSVKIANATTDAVNLSADENGLSATLTGWDEVKADSHTHANQAELDKVKDGDVAKWDAKQDAMVAITESEIEALFPGTTSL